MPQTNTSQNTYCYYYYYYYYYTYYYYYYYCCKCSLVLSCSTEWKIHDFFITNHFPVSMITYDNNIITSVWYRLAVVFIMENCHTSSLTMAASEVIIIVIIIIIIIIITIIVITIIIVTVVIIIITLSPVYGKGFKSNKPVTNLI